MNMKIIGKVTTVERVEIEVSDDELFKSVREYIKKHRPSIDLQNRYIDNDGIWKGGPDWYDMRTATEDEKEIFKAYELLANL